MYQVYDLLGKDICRCTPYNNQLISARGWPQKFLLQLLSLDTSCWKNTWYILCKQNRAQLYLIHIIIIVLISSTNYCVFFWDGSTAHNWLFISFQASAWKSASIGTILVFQFCANWVILTSVHSENRLFYQQCILCIWWMTMVIISSSANALSPTTCIDCWTSDNPKNPVLILWT